MENRIKLNKKPTYELPEEVLIGQYTYSKDVRRYHEPQFEPDICVTLFGTPSIKRKKETCNQMWIKSNNKKLIQFINNYDWYNAINSTGSKMIGVWRFKKIILEEYYGVKDDRE